MRDRCPRKFPLTFTNRFIQNSINQYIQRAVGEFWLSGRGAWATDEVLQNRIGPHAFRGWREWSHTKPKTTENKYRFCSTYDKIHVKFLDEMSRKSLNAQPSSFVNVSIDVQDYTGQPTLSNCTWLLLPAGTYGQLSTKQLSQYSIVLFLETTMVEYVQYWLALK